MVNNFCLLSPVKKQFLGQLGFCAILSGERDKMAWIKSLPLLFNIKKIPALCVLQGFCVTGISF